MPTKPEIRNMHQELKSWRKVAVLLGVHPYTAWRYALTDWEPKRDDLREAFGLNPFPRVDFIRQVRNEEGQFT